ncbi:hypothetical protein AB1L30_21350 [Bremerella sp. JC817]|uniref:hypothetical protein n=1 Tax=Bremerella sp. JC817 TaxID=3231756 RepID=UPI0034586F53
MAHGSSPSPHEEHNSQRIDAFVREAEAFLASRGGLDPAALTTLAYQFGLSRDEYQQAMALLYDGRASQAKPPTAPPPAAPPAAVAPDVAPATPPPKPPEEPPAEEYLTPEILSDDPVEEPGVDDQALVTPLPDDESEFPEVRPADLFHFVRQSRLVLTAERGWTDQALGRINYLADQMLIPPPIRGKLYSRINAADFNPAPPAEPDDTPTEAEQEAAAQEKAEKKKRQSPSRLYKHYLRKAFEALPTKRVNERREVKLIREGTSKLGLSQVLARDLLLEVAQEEGYEVASAIEKPEDQQQKQVQEETITTFQQRAATIIAGQGGVNSLTRIMIAQVAADLGMTEEERDAALASLQRQTEKHESETKNQQRATSFRQFVREKLENVNHGIVLSSLAQQLVQIGIDMHGLPHDLAWSTLREVIQEEELRLVTVEQAESHIRTLVDELMFEEQFLSIQNRQRLLAEGDQWGLDQETCQELIESRVVDFTRKQNRGQRQVALIFGAFFALLIFGGGYAIYLGSVPPKGTPGTNRVAHNSNTTLADEAIDNDPDVETKTEEVVWGRQPWWSEPLALDLLEVYQTEPSLQPRLTAICTQDASKRATAYRALLPQMIATSLARQGEDRKSIREAIAGLVHDEPNDAAIDAIAETLTEDISLEDSPITGGTPVSQMMEKAYVTVTAAEQPGLPEDRKRKLLDLLEQRLGVSFTGSANPTELTMSEMIRDQYRKIRELAASNPNEAAQLHATLSSTAQSYLPTDQVVAKDSTLVADIVSKMTSGWDSYQPVVQRVVSAQKAELMLPLLDAFEHSLKDRNIQRQVAGLFARRINRGLDADEPAQAVALVRTELGLDSFMARDGEMYRMFSRRSGNYDWKVRDDISTPQLAEELSQLGFLGVLGHAASQGEMGQRIFETASKQGAAEVTEAPAPTTSAPSTNPLALQSKIEAQIGRLQRATNPLGRIDIYRDLCTMSGDVDDVDYKVASQLAEYILAPKPRAEQSQIQSGLRAFAHWSTLKLAIADQVHSARRAADDMQEVVSVLVGETIVINNVRTARDDLREKLLQSALAGLGSQSTSGDEFSPQMANNLAEAMIDYYRFHARLQGVPDELLAQANLPDAIAAQLIAAEKSELEAMTLTDAETARFQDLKRRELAYDYLTNSPIARMAARQRLWLQLMVLRHSKQVPQLQSQLNDILQKLDQQDANAPSLLAQLRNGEMALIKFWELTGGSV